MTTMCWISYIIIAAAFVLLISSSGWLINYVLQQVANKQLEEVANEDAPKEVQKRLNIGSIIGKCENILILVFLILEAYTALAIVVTAKTIKKMKSKGSNTHQVQ